MKAYKFWRATSGSVMKDMIINSGFQSNKTHKLTDLVSVAKIKKEAHSRFFETAIFVGRMFCSFFVIYDLFVIKHSIPSNSVELFVLSLSLCNCVGK